MSRVAQLRGAAIAGVVLLATVVLVPSLLAVRDEPTIEQLKDRVDNAKVPDRPPLCIRICERQLDSAGRLYAAGDVEKGQMALKEVTAFAELARDYAIQAHKHEKESEIAIRKMARRLGNLKHTVSREEQEEIQKTVTRLQRIQDDLLAAMFKKGDK